VYYAGQINHKMIYLIKLFGKADAFICHRKYVIVYHV